MGLGLNIHAFNLKTSTVVAHACPASSAKQV
jgi:hypothetical protein